MSGSNTKNNNIYSSGIFYRPNLHGCQEEILGFRGPKPTYLQQTTKSPPKLISPPLRLPLRGPPLKKTTGPNKHPSKWLVRANFLCTFLGAFFFMNSQVLAAKGVGWKSSA